MTGRQIIDFANSLLDEEGRIDDELGLSLANLIKDLVEADRPWRMLIKEDSSNTIGSGETYLTAKSLPLDFLFDRSVVLGVGDSFTEYDPISFEKRRLFKDSKRYYIDHANKKIHICGSHDQTYTIYLYYISQTDDLTLTTSPVWPAKFHKLISILMAEMHAAGVDFDEVEFRKALEYNKQAGALFNAMKSWNTKLELQAMNYSTPASEREKHRTSGTIPDL